LPTSPTTIKFSLAKGRVSLRAVEEATARALAFPLSGSTATPTIRRVIIKNFPFSIVYRPEADGVVVFAVAHHARLPAESAGRYGPDPAQAGPRAGDGLERAGLRNGC
jgi:ParE toxin of type II toxin-antitoxin system, parDE